MTAVQIPNLVLADLASGRIAVCQECVHRARGGLRDAAWATPRSLGPCSQVCTYHEAGKPFPFALPLCTSPFALPPLHFPLCTSPLPFPSALSLCPVGHSLSSARLHLTGLAQGCLSTVLNITGCKDAKRLHPTPAASFVASLTMHCKLHSDRLLSYVCCKAPGTPSHWCLTYVEMPFNTVLNMQVARRTGEQCMNFMHHPEQLRQTVQHQVETVVHQADGLLHSPRRSTQTRSALICQSVPLAQSSANAYCKHAHWHVYTCVFLLVISWTPVEGAADRAAYMHLP